MYLSSLVKTRYDNDDDCNNNDDTRRGARHAQILKEMECFLVLKLIFQRKNVCCLSFLEKYCWSQEYFYIFA